MLKKNKYLILVVGWVCVIAYLSLFNLSNAPKVTIHNFDKYVHLVFHFIDTILWYLFLKFEFKNKKYINHCLILAMLIDFVYGCTIEFMQGLFTETRHADFMDVIFNVLGTVIAAILIKIVIKRTGR